MNILYTEFFLQLFLFLIFTFFQNFSFISKEKDKYTKILKI